MYVTWDTPPLFETSTSTMRLRHFCRRYTITSRLNNIRIRYIFIYSVFFCTLTRNPWPVLSLFHKNLFCLFVFKLNWKKRCRGENKLCLCVSCYQTGSFQQLRQQTHFDQNIKRIFFFFLTCFLEFYIKNRRWVIALWDARGSIFQYFLCPPHSQLCFCLAKKNVKSLNEALIDGVLSLSFLWSAGPPSTSPLPQWRQAARRRWWVVWRGPRINLHCHWDYILHAHSNAETLTESIWAVKMGLMAIDWRSELVYV